MSVRFRVPDPTLRVGYRRTWSVLAIAAGTAGALGAAVAMPLVVLLTSAATGWLVVQFLAGTTAWSTGVSPVRTILPSLAVGCLTPVLPGAVVLLGAPAAVVWTVLALTAPPLVSWALTVRWSPESPESPETPAAAAGSRPVDLVSLTPTAVAEASTSDLVRLWVTSTRELAARPGPSRTATLVRVRAAVLDTLQRRDPHGFASWLAHDPVRTSPRAHLHG
ncbi:MAG: hypothetical protein JWR42_2191 [Marmoricola sp.]|nr:hypothetical protein [Marmoricola sp.]